MAPNSRPRVDTPMDDHAPPEVDIFTGRLNLSAGQPQRVLQSLMSRRLTAAAPTSVQSNIALSQTVENGQNHIDDEEANFDALDALDEKGGVGIAPSGVDDDTLAGIFNATSAARIASNEQLLERLIGRKASQAKKKEMNAMKTNAADQTPTTNEKVRTNAKSNIRDDDSEEEDGGRASAFTSKQRKRNPVQSLSKTEESDMGEDTEGGRSTAVGGLPVKDSSIDKDVELSGKGGGDDEDSQNESRKSAKRRAGGGYLDELLEARAKGKKKKKKATK